MSTTNGLTSKKNKGWEHPQQILNPSPTESSDFFFQTSDNYRSKPKTSNAISNHHKLKAVIVDPYSNCSTTLNILLKRLFPELIILKCLKRFDETRQFILSERLDLIFVDVEVINDILSVKKAQLDDRIITLSTNSEDALRALRNNQCGFIQLPIKYKEVAISIQCAIHKLNRRNSSLDNDTSVVLPHNKLVGIPTLEGIEFINTEDIIRCEGLQKCTVIVTTMKTDIISSYNLGKFIQLLKGRGFFSCHRSHFINLKFVKKYTREGYIHFNANSKPVPLARRRKADFLNKLSHL